MNQKPRRRRAELTRHPEFPIDGQLGDDIGIDAFIDQHRGMAAQFHQYGFHGLDSKTREVLAHICRSRQSDQPRDWRQHKGARYFVRRAKDNIQNAFRQACIQEALREKTCRRGRFLGRLEDHGASRSQ